MACVIYDEVLNKKGKVIGVKGAMLIEDSDKPEKIYPTHVDEYGDIRDKYLPLEDFISKYGEELLPMLKRMSKC